MLLDFWLRTAEDTKFLLFFASPEDELANFILNNGYCIDGYKNALGAWAIRTRAMQVFYMSNRDRCLLLNTKSANRNPERFVRLSSEILDIKLARPGVITQLMEQDHYYLQFLTATLLVGEDVISELYDEVRSAATVLDDNDLSMKDAKSRSEDLIPLSLKALQQNNLEAAEKMALAEELEATKLHIVQIQQELEFFYLKERNTCDINRKYASYLAQDPLLRLTRVLRTNDIPG